MAENAIDTLCPSHDLATKLTIYHIPLSSIPNKVSLGGIIAVRGNLINNPFPSAIEPH